MRLSISKLAPARYTQRHFVLKERARLSGLSRQHVRSAFSVRFSPECPTTLVLVARSDHEEGASSIPLCATF